MIPELEGRLHGYALRVPLPTGSVVDLTFESERPTSAEEINGVFAARSDRAELTGILLYSEEPLASADIVGSPFVDLRCGLHERHGRDLCQGARLVRQ